MTSVNALPVKVPLPSHEPSARFPKLFSQYCITEISKHLIGIIQTNNLQRGCAIKDLHILLDLCGSLRDRPKLPVYFRPCDIRWSETDDAVSVNRAERFLIPSDMGQTVVQQPSSSSLRRSFRSTSRRNLSFCGVSSSFIQYLQSQRPY